MRSSASARVVRRHLRPGRGAHRWCAAAESRQGLRDETGLPVLVAENPLTSVVLGAGKMLTDLSLLRLRPTDARSSILLLSPLPRGRQARGFFALDIVPIELVQVGNSRWPSFRSMPATDADLRAARAGSPGGGGDGTASPGDQLPRCGSSRSISVNANTVARVYAELERAGVIETRRGGGLFVCGTAARAHPPREHDRRLRAFITRILADADAAGFTLEDVIQALEEPSRHGDEGQGIRRGRAFERCTAWYRPGAGHAEESCMVSTDPALG